MKFRTALWAIAIVLALHVVGIIFHLYWEWNNLDVLMHGLGGFSMAMLALSLLNNESARKLSWDQKFLFVIGFVALIGVLWEFLEYGIDQYHLITSDAWQALTLRDTLGDLMNDLIGGILSYLAFGNK